MSFDWLTARPIAHRGLHDRAQGRIENSRAAAQAAIARGFAIECDAQAASDGEAMVFHDFTLDRLTNASGRLKNFSARQLTQIPLLGGAEPIPTLAQFLDFIAGRAPVTIEIKSAFDGDLRLAERVARVVGARAAPIAIKSFDPALIAHLRAHGAALGLTPRPLGVVAEASYEGEDWGDLSAQDRRKLAALHDYRRTQPDFLSYRVDDLPHAASHLFRAALNKPVMAWTVRAPEQRALADQWADQMVFEGFIP